MPKLITPEFRDELAINIDALLKDFTEEDFFEMCRQNPDLRVEMSKEGDIIFYAANWRGNVKTQF